MSSLFELFGKETEEPSFDLSDANQDSFPVETPILNIDGVWGKDTTRAIQELLGVEETGLILRQPNTIRSSAKGTGTGWDWTFPSRVESDVTIAALQYVLNLDDVGVLNRETIQTLASIVDLPNKTVLDQAVVSAIQEAINNNTLAI